MTDLTQCVGKWNKGRILVHVIRFTGNGAVVFKTKDVRLLLPDSKRAVFKYKYRL